jgi:branched-subunit amino acid transport protein AzlD
VPDNSRLLAVMLTGAVITLGLRTIPFAVLALLRRSPVVQRLSPAMPAGVLTILAIYFLRDRDLANPARGGPQALGVLPAAGLWQWRDNLSLAVVASTATYMLLVNLMPGLHT